MPRLLRRLAVIAASLLLAAATVVVPASASSGLAAPRIVYIKQKHSPTRHLGVLGFAESRDPVNQLLGSEQLWEMNVVSTHQGAWVVTFKLYGSNLCLDKSLDTSTSNIVYLYTCLGTANQRWLLQRTGSVTGANLHYIRTYYQGTPGNCLRTYTTGNSIVGNCADELDEYAIYVI
ncbi:RICIN domain-containing protein [Nonomuraea turcica]|uniref:RICIN domain-containing protein n=1 Tax=Nonomuraea sp. G32 TaxID=3067274 RepID=UPI00273C48A7|nr:RICIN domain-containing protein [Nonomuraea sp. G32]MDP4505897.1 RICIN domain-containing protein [Nonomuraea sp. G32]